MDKIALGEYPILVAVGAVVGCLILWSILKMVFGKKETGKHIQLVRCGNCSWQGKVSRYAGRCPRCNQPLGDQKVLPKT